MSSGKHVGVGGGGFDFYDQVIYMVEFAPFVLAMTLCILPLIHRKYRCGVALSPFIALAAMIGGWLSCLFLPSFGSPRRRARTRAGGAAAEQVGRPGRRHASHQPARLRSRPAGWALTDVGYSLLGARAVNT